MNNSQEGRNRCPAPRYQNIIKGRVQKSFYTKPMNDTDLKFRTLPFQRIINVLVSPMCIVYSKSMTSIKNRIQPHFGAYFYLSVSDLQRISQLNNGKHSYQLQVRIGEQVPGMQELSEVLPQSVSIHINGKPIPMDHLKSPLNVDPIEYLHLNTVHANCVGGIWLPCSSFFFMVVHLVEIISVEELVTDIKIDNNRFFFALNTKQAAAKMLENSREDVSLEAYKLTLLCPINKLKMKLPAKSVNCNHLQCFDLQAFISLNKKEPTWMCPICMNPCILDDLKIDSFLMFIINSITVPKTCVEIEVYANGKWKPCNFNSDSGEDVMDTACGSSKKNILEIDLGNSDDEDLGGFVKTVLPITNAGTSNDLKPTLMKIIKKEDTNE